MNRLILILAAAVALVTGPAAAQSGDEMNDAVTLIIHFDASDDGVEEFAAIMDGVGEAMSGEEGFVSAQVYRDIDDPTRFVLTEIWASKELHLDHFDRINESGDWAYIRTLLDADPVMGYYRDPHG